MEPKIFTISTTVQVAAKNEEHARESVSGILVKHLYKKKNGFVLKDYECTDVWEEE